MKRKPTEKPVPSSSIGRYLAGLDTHATSAETQEQTPPKKKRTPKAQKPAKERK